MAKCEVCGNEYDHCMTVSTAAGAVHTFDCFECAIEELAPRCQQCHCHVIGHGVQEGDTVFCSAHCSREAGIVGMTDRTSPLVKEGG